MFTDHYSDSFDQSQYEYDVIWRSRCRNNVICTLACVMSEDVSNVLPNFLTNFTGRQNYFFKILKTYLNFIPKFFENGMCLLDIIVTRGRHNDQNMTSSIDISKLYIIFGACDVWRPINDVNVFSGLLNSLSFFFVGNRFLLNFELIFSKFSKRSVSYAYYFKII